MLGKSGRDRAGAHHLSSLKLAVLQVLGFCLFVFNARGTWDLISPTRGHSTLCIRSMLLRVASVFSSSLTWFLAHKGSHGFFRQEYWNGLLLNPLLDPPGDLPNPGLNRNLSHLLQWQVGFLPLAPHTWETHIPQRSANATQQDSHAPHSPPPPPTKESRSTAHTCLSQPSAATL